MENRRQVRPLFAIDHLSVGAFSVAEIASAARAVPLSGRPTAAGLITTFATCRRGQSERESQVSACAHAIAPPFLALGRTSRPRRRPAEPRPSPAPSARRRALSACRTRSRRRGPPRSAGATISAHWDILITSASSWFGRRDDRVSPRRSSPGNRCFRVLRGSFFKWPRGPFSCCRLPARRVRRARRRGPREPGLRLSDKIRYPIVSPSGRGATGRPTPRNSRTGHPRGGGSTDPRSEPLRIACTGFAGSQGSKARTRPRSFSTSDAGCPRATRRPTIVVHG